MMSCRRAHDGKAGHKPLQTPASFRAASPDVSVGWLGEKRAVTRAGTR